MIKYCILASDVTKSSIGIHFGILADFASCVRFPVTDHLRMIGSSASKARPFNAHAYARMWLKPTADI